MKHPLTYLTLVFASASPALAQNTAQVLQEGILAEARIGEASLEEMSAWYAFQLKKFNQSYQEASNAAERKTVLNAYLSYADREIQSKAAGTGLLFRTLNEIRADIQNDVNQGKLDAARSRINSSAQSVLNFF